MSDDRVERTMNDLEQKNWEAGSPFSPERMREVRQKLESEQRELAKLTKQGQADADASKQESERPLLPHDTPTFGAAADARLRRVSADIPAPAADNTAPRPGEATGFQPPAIGERAINDRAETGPEKKDKEIYLAERRLSKL